MKKLLRGILDFRANVLPGKRDLFARLATGQNPDVLFITCSDSRVAPNWFASTDPGDLFVIRNVGNLVPPCGEDLGSDHSVAAAIEFCLSNLKIRDIVVCGHSGCGAIHALATGADKGSPSHLRHWLRFAEFSTEHPASELAVNTGHSVEDRLSQGNVLQQIAHLKSYPLIRERLDAGTLRLHAWWFEIGKGSVAAYDEASRSFQLIDEKVAAPLLGAD
jgi:carbonic anhydrase